MNEEIIKMAREAGFRVGPSRDGPDDVWGVGANLERFFHMAQAAEREACAKVCDTYEEWCGPWGQDDNLYAATESAKEIAAAIRARGQA